MKAFVVIALLLALAPAEAHDPVKLTGRLYRKGTQWFFSVPEGKSVYRVTALPPKTKFSGTSIDVAIEADEVGCAGPVPCLRLRSLEPVLVDPVRLTPPGDARMVPAR